MERFTRDQVLEILHLPPARLRYWERLRLVVAEEFEGERIYTLQDLISLRAISRLVGAKVPATRLREVLERLSREAPHTRRRPLAELVLKPLGGDVVMARDGHLGSPISGQQAFDLDALDRSGSAVHPIRRIDSRDCVLRALDLERRGAPFEQIEAAYREALVREPNCLEAWLNLGTLFLREGHAERAEMAYREALDLDDRHPVVRFNMAHALEEQGRLDEARSHLAAAVQLRPDFADAHYNLALLLERQGHIMHARHHWLEYLRLDPQSEWAGEARRHLAPSLSADGKVVAFRPRR